MKIGTLEMSNDRVAILAAIWIGCWAWPVAVRPLVFAAGRPADAVVRVAQPTLFGVRCKITAATKLDGRSVRFYGYGAPQACRELGTASAVKLRLLKAGPVYWVQLDNDYGFWRMQVFIALLGFLLTTSAAGALIYHYSRPREKSGSQSDLRDLLNKL